MFSIHQLSKAFGKTVIFNDYSADFTADRVCIIGPNGTGKSTLLCMIAGLVNYPCGYISFNNKPLDKTNTAIASDSIVMPGFITANDVLLLTKSSWQSDWPQAIIDGFNFSPHLNKRISELSAGNLKKLQLINAFMRSPQILLLDEPNIALDEPSVAFLWQQMAAFAGMIIVASNEPDLFNAKSYVIHDLCKVNA